MWDTYGVAILSLPSAPLNPAHATTRRAPIVVSDNFRPTFFLVTLTDALE